MSDPFTITLWPKVVASEIGAVRAAAQQVHTHLGQAGLRVQVSVQHPTTDAPPESAAPQVAVLSLQLELSRASDADKVIRTRWTRHIQQIQRAGAACVLCTVFRHVSDRQHGQPSALAEHILRLNLLAAQLSYDTGASVADIDRALAEAGAVHLKADYRIGSGPAAWLAGHTIARTLLMDALDGRLPSEHVDRAAHSLGNVHALLRQGTLPPLPTP